MFLLSIFISSMICGVIGKQNILLIVVDDLRPSLGCYGDSRAHTPNIDALANRGVLFTEAYAQQSLCAPSRNSFLTSRRPDTLKLYDFYSYWRDTAGNFTTLPEHLKNNGYTTMSIGKIFHPGHSSNGSDDSPYSWSRKPFHPFTDRYKETPLCQSASNGTLARNIVCPVCITRMPNKTLPDIETLKAANLFIRRHRENGKQFFLAVGFQKPHIPLKYPQKYLEHHPLEKFNVPNNYNWSKDVSSVAYNPWTDLRKREDIKKFRLKFPYEEIPITYARRIIQSYYAAVTYIDDLIGSLLNQLAVYDLKHRTTIILMSDHGWSLGEHGVWAKYSNFDITVRVPVIISIPGVTYDPMFKGTHLETYYLQPRNWREISNLSIVLNRHTNTRRDYITTNALIELVDIFPTIADIANLPVPICLDDSHWYNNQVSQHSNLCSEGVSFLPVIHAAMSRKNVPWKKGVFSQYPRPSIVPTLIPNSDEPRLNEITIMGYTIKTREYRYVAWHPFNHSTAKSDWNTTIAEELYNHKLDKEEIMNLVTKDEFSKIKSQLRIQLKNGWRDSLPRQHKYIDK